MLITPKTLPAIVKRGREACQYESILQTTEALGIHRAWLYRLEGGRYSKKGIYLASMNDIFACFDITEIEALFWAAEHTNHPAAGVLEKFYKQHNDLFKE